MRSTHLVTVSLTSELPCTSRISQIIMVQDFQPSLPDALRRHHEALSKHTKSMQELTLAITQLFCYISNTSNPTKPQNIPKPKRWFFRSWEEVSRAKPNDSGDIVSGDPDWSPGPGMDNIALYFAEFHSDKYNRKDTATISATYDIIRALKKTYAAWKYGCHAIRDANKIFITAIHSSEFFLAKDLLDIALRPPLFNRLSKQARDRLRLSERDHLHDSEVVFLHCIPASDVKFQLSLEELFNRGLERVLPELFETVGPKNSIPGPKEIRDGIGKNASWKPTVGASRYLDIYNMITQGSAGKTAASLSSTKALLNDDRFLKESAVQEEGNRLLEEEYRSIADKGPCRVMVRRKVHIGFVEDEAE